MGHQATQNFVVYAGKQDNSLENCKILANNHETTTVTINQRKVTTVM